MASLKLRVEERSALYYGKHKYRVVVTAPYLFLSYWQHDMEAFKAAVQMNYKEQLIAFKRWGKRKPTPLPTEAEYKRISKIISFKNKFAALNNTTIRQESNNISFFCSDITLYDPVEKFNPDTTVTEVKLLPSGVKYFEREPNYNYRLQLKGVCVDNETKDDFISYIKRTPNIQCNSVLERWMKIENRFHYSYLYDNCTIDYDDSSVLTMMHLVFPKIIGKSFKLEKRPD